MNIRQLEFFLSAADTGSFYAAAEQLYVSRPAISKSISQLESEIGQTLFHRNADGVYLTDTAKMIYPKIQMVVDAFDAL
jgi:DNA-binding transcriptional LysR family regulator